LNSSYLREYILGRIYEDPLALKQLSLCTVVVLIIESHSRWVTCQNARYDRYIGYVSVTIYVLALSSDSGFPRFGCLIVVFLLTKFPLR
jgi:hypothetical protein